MYLVKNFFRSWTIICTHIFLNLYLFIFALFARSFGLTSRSIQISEEEKYTNISDFLHYKINYDTFYLLIEKILTLCSGRSKFCMYNERHSEIRLWLKNLPFLSRFLEKDIKRVIAANNWGFEKIEFQLVNLI